MWVREDFRVAGLDVGGRVGIPQGPWQAQCVLYKNRKEKKDELLGLVGLFKEFGKEAIGGCKAGVTDHFRV